MKRARLARIVTAKQYEEIKARQREDLRGEIHDLFHVIDARLRGTTKDVWWGCVLSEEEEDFDTYYLEENRGIWEQALNGLLKLIQELRVTLLRSFTERSETASLNTTPK